MKLMTFLLVATLPVAALAQQTPVQQSTLPTLQQMMDQKSAQVADAVAQFRNQISQDQQINTTLMQENAALTTKNSDLQKQVDNLQAQLTAAKAPVKK